VKIVLERLCEFEMIENGIGKEFESKLGASEEVEVFECFETSNQECSDFILSNEFPFNLTVNCNLYVNYFLMKSVMITNFESLFSVNPKKTRDCDVFYFDCFVISVLRRLLFCD
jgi:hypothetical protein